MIVQLMRRCNRATQEYLIIIVQRTIIVNGRFTRVHLGVVEGVEKARHSLLTREYTGAVYRAVLELIGPMHVFSFLMRLFCFTVSSR